MKILDFLHRWTGGLIGLLLAVLGLSGAILAHKHAWIALPHKADPPVREVPAVAGAVARLVAGQPAPPESIIFASGGFGVIQLRLGGGTGAYADQAGTLLAQWDSQWQRPELWLFDLHHHLFAGETGETVAGIAALAGLGFVVTGILLWWPLRRTFAPRALPTRLTRGAILRHHRDLGVLAAPLLAISLATGALLTLQPLAPLLLDPFSGPAGLRAATAKPAVKGGPLAPDLDWSLLLGEARRRFPDAEFRILSLPRKSGDLVSLRLRQPAEWLPNGRTMIWFDAADGRVVEARDALAYPGGVRFFQALYPVHAGKVGGLAWRLVMTLSGLALALLGSFAVYSFWFQRKPVRKKRSQAAAA